MNLFKEVYMKIYEDDLSILSKAKTELAAIQNYVRMRKARKALVQKKVGQRKLLKDGKIGTKLVSIEAETPIKGRSIEKQNREVKYVHREWTHVQTKGSVENLKI